MKEVASAQDLVESLQNAGEKLVILDFFSPGCGGCKALHPKICQFAEMNPDVQFLQVNHEEEHKSMAYSLNVHVLPFFRFYKGAHGRLCSFSCNNATIQKFKDALARLRNRPLQPRASEGALRRRNCWLLQQIENWASVEARGGKCTRGSIGKYSSNLVARCLESY